MVDSLSCRLEGERISGNFPGIKIVRGMKNLNHSQFVDTLLMGGASTIIVERLKQVLDFIISASIGKVNHLKIQFFGWNESPHILHSISQNLQFSYQEEWTSFKYLGMPLSLRNPMNQYWQSIIGKNQIKISSMRIPMDKSNRMIFFNKIYVYHPSSS
jgi:hypothetical protein